MTKCCSVKGGTILLAENEVTVLMAENASSALAVDDGSEPANGKQLFSPWVDGRQGVEWLLRAEQATRCEIRLLARGDAARWELKVGDKAMPSRTIGSGFQRVACGEVDIPKGETQVALRLVDVPEGAAFKSVELVPGDAGLARRAAALRSDATWMRERKYGVMLQWGAWGYPPQGDRLPFPQMYERFDLEAFARMVDEEMGAGWVVWSLTWRGSRFAIPLKTVDALLPGHTMARDFRRRACRRPGAAGAQAPALLPPRT